MNPVGGSVIRQEWLNAAPVEPPCGPNLEYDQDFIALDNAARGRPEQQYGDTVIAAEEPDWPDVLARASTLLDRSRDLRIVHLLTRALTRTQGLPGLRAGVALARELLTKYWDDVHPRLDVDGEPDPVMRANAVASFADPQGLVQDARLATVMRSTLGSFTLRDVEKILDRASPGGASAITPEQLRAAIRDAIVADGEALGEAPQIIEALDGIRAIFLQHLEPAQGPDLSPMRRTVAVLADLLREIRASLVAPPTGVATAVATAGGVPGPTTPPPGIGTGEIRNRDDAIRALERVCEYLAASEPTNPAPLLIRRAQRLMRMSFLDIIRDLVPDAAGQVENVTGTSQKSSGGHAESMPPR